MMPQTDAELVHTALLGDTEAFDSLVQRYSRTVYRTVVSQVSDTSVADDVTQEVFLHAYRNLKQLQTPETFADWLHRIAVNIVKTHSS